MSETRRYPTKPLECWNKAKELRTKYYKVYAEEGHLRWAGSTWAFDSLLAGFGRDVVHITGEPYGASVAFNRPFALKCQEAAEARGWARDLCSYLRNYFGSMYLNEYNFGGKWPKADFCFTSQICCTHTKWYQHVAEYEKIPYFAIDVASGPSHEMNDRRVQYLVDQFNEAIEYFEKALGRKYQDELLIEALDSEFRSASVWADICALNKAVPVPLDEKSMHSLYVFGTIHKHDKEMADFYEELREEVKDRIANGIAAVANERCRLITDSQPPWGFLNLYRYLQKFGAVSVGNLYVYGLVGIWEDQPDGSWGAAKTPAQKGVEIKTREQALWEMAKWNLRKPLWQHFYDPQLKTDMQIRMAKEWKLDGVILHYNRGCEGTSIGIAENRLGLMKAGIPVMTYEGNMGDEREFDETRVFARIDAFMESMNFDKMED
ncbi:MAG: benzoyl-CoA reductase, bzd-type, subunit O [Chloroflexi bacterium]|nr:benzoyl-CoA reductase, bzd-type, subunit O [Chloroflexota bacterium]